MHGKSHNGSSCSGCRCSGPSKGTNMRNIVDRLVLWIAELLDRNLLTVPDWDN